MTRGAATLSAAAAEFVSRGPDRVAGTADDLHSWDAPP